MSRAAITRDRGGPQFGILARRVYDWDRPAGWAITFGLGPLVFIYRTRGAR